MPVAAAQGRMARAQLDDSRPGLGNRSASKTITDIELGRYAGNRDSTALIESVFRKAGVEFLPPNGVRVHEPADAGQEGYQFSGGLPLSVASSPAIAPNGPRALSLRR